MIEIVGSEALNNKEYLGRTPLHYSALVTDSDRSLYDWLVEQGAETDVKDSEGKTPEDYLEETVNFDTIPASSIGFVRTLSLVETLSTRLKISPLAKALTTLQAKSKTVPGPVANKTD